MPQTAEWTIMVFLNGDNDLERFALKDFREMAKVGSTDQVNIIVQMDRNGVYATTDPQWSQCLRFRIGKDMEPVPAQAVEDLGEVNMGEGRELGNFVQWAMNNYPARKYMLDIWGHGQGWRIARSMAVRGTSDEIVAYREFRKQTSNAEIRSHRGLRHRAGIGEDGPITFSDFSVIPSTRVVETSYRYISIDDTNNDKLFNREIQDSLATVLNGHSLDVIGFDACLMGMVETGYAMRRAGKVMVGSQELEPGDGWHYADWLRRLVDNPGMDAADLGREMVASYEDYYTNGNYDPDVTLSAIDLSQMDPLAGAIDDLVREMMHKMPQEIQHIQTARNSCKVYAPGYGVHGIDLRRFCEQLHSSTGDDALRAKAGRVASVIGSSVLHNFAGQGRQGDYGSHGLAIYFPQTRALFNTDPDSVGYHPGNTHYPVEFVQKHRWGHFLQEYYRLVP